MLVERKILNTTQVSSILKVNPEIITYLRKHEELPFFKQKKFIMFYEDEIIRWRNRNLAEKSEVVIHLPTYFTQIKMYRFCSYDVFKECMREKVFMDDDSVIQYIKRHNIWKDIKDVVGDIVSYFHNSRKPKCVLCGGPIYSSLDVDKCSTCTKLSLKGSKDV